MFFEFIEDVTQVADKYLSRFEGVPPFIVARVLPEIIREYDDLVLGSQIAIKISFHLKAAGIEAGPEVVAREIFPHLVSVPSREYFLGRDVYVNAKLNIREGLRYYLAQALESLNLPFISNCKSIQEVSLRVLGECDLPVRFIANYSSLFDSKLFLDSGVPFSENEKKLIYLASITDPEFDEVPLLKGYASRDNAVWLWAQFEKIIDGYFVQREVEPEFYEAKIKSSLHTVPASHALLEKTFDEVATFITLYDYYLLEALKRDKPELFWIHVLELQRSVLSLWNDPWCRLAIEARSVKGDSGEMEELFKALRLLRTSIAILLI